MKKLFFLFLIISALATNTFSQNNWSELTSGVTTALNSVSAIDDNNIWACGDGGVIIRSTNGGTSFTNATAAPIPNTLPLYCIFGIDASTALVTGSSATATFVYRTSNAGVNWVQVFTQTGGFIDAIAMGNAVAGFMYGDPVGGRWSLWGTINGGLTWDSTQFYLPQAGAEAGWNNAFFFDAVGQAVSFGTSNTRIYRSTNLILWSAQPTTGTVNSTALWYNSTTNGMTGGTVMMFTSNSGTNWNATGTPLPGSGNIIGINGFGTNWWAARSTAIIYFSNNNGANWATQYTAPAGTYTHMSKSRGGAGTMYAVRNNGGISKAINLTGIIPVITETPKYFSLEQNYPNPFNPTTKIKFAMPEGNARDVKIVVFDELGRQIAVVVDNRLTAGTYEVNFDAANLASGVYYYKLTAGDYSQTKKMTLIK